MKNLEEAVRRSHHRRAITKSACVTSACLLRHGKNLRRGARLAGAVSKGNDSTTKDRPKDTPLVPTTISDDVPTAYRARLLYVQHNELGSCRGCAQL